MASDAVEQIMASLPANTATRLFLILRCQRVLILICGWGPQDKEPLTKAGFTDPGECSGSGARIRAFVGIGVRD